MSEKLYAIKESTMAAIAASLRDVAGTTEPINGDEISGYVTTTLPTAILSNLDEVLEDQDDIISQIQTALEGKASATPTLQEKTVSPSTSAQTVTPDSGYDGLSEVTVNAMPTATQATPSISVSSSGLITASATQTAGYVSAGTKSNTKQLTTQAAKTITPSTSSQTAVASGRYTTGAVTVAAIPSSYVKPTTTKTATTYTPTTSNQTIAAGTYCSGVQTIKGDSNLVAANIKKGVSIFGVTGTHEGGEDLTSVISEQATLISQLETALENKASGGGGGSVETCELKVRDRLDGCNIVTVTVADSEGIHHEVHATELNNTLIIPNVVKGSVAYVCNSTGNPWVFVSSGAFAIEGYQGIIRVFEITGDDGDSPEGTLIAIYADDMPMLV